MTIERIRKTAIEVRRRFIEVAEPFFDEWAIDPTDLAGACGLASWLLVRELRMRGIAASLAGCCGHVWVECDRMIVDITATQFGLGEVEIVRRSDKSKSALVAKYWPLEKSDREVRIELRDWENAEPRARQKIARRMKAAA